MTRRGGLAVAVLSAVAAAGVGLFAVTRTWGTETHARPYPLPDETVTTVGTTIAPWALPAAIVAMAAALALVATGGAARRMVVLVLAASGVVLAASGAFGVARLAGVWPVVVATMGVCLVVVSAWSWSRYRDWPRMSARYDRREPEPAIVAPVDSDGALDSARLWDAIDRGDDPTR